MTITYGNIKDYLDKAKAPILIAIFVSILNVKYLFIIIVNQTDLIRANFIIEETKMYVNVKMLSSISLKE